MSHGHQTRSSLITQRLSNECWYASVCMVAYYREAGPRLGIPEQWQANNGINLNDFIKLAQAEGSKSIMTPGGALTAQQVEVFLVNNGPIWCAGHWDGVGHIVVLTGVDGTNVYINDPNPYKGKPIVTVDWFNQKLDRMPNCLMYKPAR